MEVLIVKIRKDKIKYLIIPKNSNIKEGERVLVTSNLNLITKFIEEENKND